MNLSSARSRAQLLVPSHPLGPALLVAVAYGAAGAAWILASEWLLHLVIAPENTTLVQVIRGLGFVGVTSAALYLVLARMMRALRMSNHLQASLASELRVRAAQQRDLAHRLMRAEEETRHAVAKDLHDGPLQLLTLSFMQLDTATRPTDDGTVVDAEQVARSMTTIREAADEIRAVVRALHPPLLAELGLSAALERYCREIASRASREVTFHVDGEIPRMLGQQSSITAFRIVQEAVANAVKHTRSGPITVDVGFRHQALHIAVTDRGPGFEPDATPGTGLGLISMRERAESVSGQFQLTSTPVDGTTVRVQVPVDAD